MSSEWEVVSLGDVAETLNGAGVKQEFFSVEGVPLARVSNFQSGTVDLSDCIFVDSEHAKKWYKHRLNFGDVVVATVGSWPPNWSSVVGKVVRVPISALGAIQNQNTCRVTAKSERLDQRFLYYLLSAQDFLLYAANNAAGSASQARLGISNLEKYTFCAPPLEVQKEIGSLLGALDDRITLLRGTNTTLEAIAQALFKSWFVDFDPVHAKQQGRVPEGMDAQTAALFPESFEESELGMVPKGWRVKPIGDLVPTVGGATPDTKNESFWSPAEFHWTSPKDLSAAASPVLLATEKKVSAKGLKKISSGLLSEGSLLMSSRAPIGYLAIAAVPVAINQGYIAISAGGTLSPIYMLFWCKANMESIKGNANGSTFMEISKKAFRPILTVEPKKEVLNVFDDFAGALFQRLKANEEQAQALVSLRDTLLPRLITGQLRLPEAQALVEETTAASK